ncbi:hypothetical protein F7725_013998 [Dissostichus mawsoni]|uniref:Uncharacterized protein n=1 Tax=Dissostichus mawsoni TaxID=36200 RepID=A0A7J5YV40_DISMA|nr:hypothetical protein F7725_013998 [Dissostichus mawsoni]
MAATSAPYLNKLACELAYFQEIKYSVCRRAMVPCAKWTATSTTFNHSLPMRSILRRGSESELQDGEEHLGSRWSISSKRTVSIRRRSVRAGCSGPEGCQQRPGGKPSVATVTELRIKSLCIVTKATTKWQKVTSSHASPTVLLCLANLTSLQQPHCQTNPCHLLPPPLPPPLPRAIKLLTSH